MSAKASPKKLSIGELAKLVGVGVETIRFYERKRIIPQPARPPSGFRVYSKDVADRLMFVREAQEMGFTLKEIGDLLALRDDPQTDAAAMRGRASAKLAQLDAKIDRLARMRSTLQDLVSRCRGIGGLSECAIAEALSTPTAATRKRRSPNQRKTPMKSTDLIIDGMHCEGCAKTIQALLSSEDGVKAATVSFANRSARVMFDPAAIDVPGLIKAVERAGYQVSERPQ